MSHFAENINELQRRQGLIERSRMMICNYLGVFSQDETSVMTEFHDFFVQISFTSVHPLITIFFVRRVNKIHLGMLEIANRMNLTTVLGSHAVNDTADCYTYRATLWLDADLSEHRFQEILDRCIDEASRAFHAINS